MSIGLGIGKMIVTIAKIHRLYINDQRYILLSQKDISFMSAFFHQEQIQSKIEKMLQSQKYYNKVKNIICFTAVGIIALSAIIYPHIESILMTILGVWLVSSIIIACMPYFSQKGSYTKLNLMNEFTKYINPWIHYQAWSELFHDKLSTLVNIGLINRYSRINSQEDSIKYNIWNKKWEKVAGVTGMEVVTSKKRTRKGKNGHTSTYYVTNNHCYIIKITFEAWAERVKNFIHLKEDISDNFVKKILKVLTIVGWTIWSPLLIWIYIENEEILNLIFSMYLKAFQYPAISITFLIWYTICTYFIYSAHRSKKRVKLENINFEKEFDVFSKSWLASRKILTPKNMEQIVKYVNKIQRNRIYEIYFDKNYMYIKYDILKRKKLFAWREKYIGEVSISKKSSPEKLFSSYLEFYLEIKGIQKLVKSLSMYYNT